MTRLGDYRLPCLEALAPLRSVLWTSTALGELSALCPHYLGLHWCILLTTIVDGFFPLSCLRTRVQAPKDTQFHF